jgi:O-antigen/teichoic acid export membrane protein
LKFPEFRFAVLKRSLKFYLIQIVYGLYTGLSRVLQGIFGTIESVAVLSVGLLLSNIAIMMGDNFAKVVMPYFSKAWAEADWNKIQEAYYEVTRFNAYLILPVVLFVMVNASKILSLLGPEYATGVLVLNLLLFSQFFSTLVGPNGTLLSMTDKERYEIFNGTVKLALALALGFLLGPRYSWGIAFSIAGSDVLVNILKTLEVKKLFGFWPHKPKVFLFLGILTLIEIAGFLMLGKIANLVVFVLVNGLFGLLIYFLSFYFSPEAKDRATLLRAIRRFSSLLAKN